MKEEFSDEVANYLRDLSADKEEARCVRMWVKDGHSVYENDYPGLSEEYEYYDMDFLTASRNKQVGIEEYTESFYDPKTQLYIRKLNPTRNERRRLRKHIRNGGRFIVPHVHTDEMVDFITHIRTYKEDLACYFDSDLGDWITKYGAEYLISRNRTGDFIKFLEGKEDYIKAITPTEIIVEIDDLPF